MKIFILTIVMVIASIAVFSQDIPENIVEKFFVDYENELPDIALDNLHANMPYADRIKDDIDNQKMQFNGLQKLVGEYIGYDLIAKKELANCFVILSYLVRFERQPVRFTFEFYKPKRDWGLYSFSYDDDFDEELEEAMKLYFLELEK